MLRLVLLAISGDIRIGETIILVNIMKIGRVKHMSHNLLRIDGIAVDDVVDAKRDTLCEDGVRRGGRADENDLEFRVVHTHLLKYFPQIDASVQRVSENKDLCTGARQILQNSLPVCHRFDDNGFYPVFLHFLREIIFILLCRDTVHDFLLHHTNLLSNTGTPREKSSK